MLKESDGLDTNCAGDRGEAEPRVAAIVNWYGVTDVGDLLQGDNLITRSNGSAVRLTKKMPHGAPRLSLISARITLRSSQFTAMPMM